jgi:hypothetical protein
VSLFPCILACQATLGYLSSTTLTTCPNYLNCATSVISLKGIIPNHIKNNYHVLLQAHIFHLQI